MHNVYVYIPLQDQENMLLRMALYSLMKMQKYSVSQYKLLIAPVMERRPLLSACLQFPPSVVSPSILPRLLYTYHLLTVSTEHITDTLSMWYGFVLSDVVYTWEYPEYKVVEDSESLVAQLCLAEESGTLTSQVRVTVTTIPISATGKRFSTYIATRILDILDCIARSIECVDS